MKKPWYKSKTFWFGIAQIMVGVGEFLLSQDLDNIGLPVVITGILTIVFRFLTKVPITK